MRLISLLPLLAGCGAADPVDEPVRAVRAVDQAAPPGTYGITLSAEGAAIPGETITFEVSGAQRFETVYVALGFAERLRSLCPPVLNGGCIDLQSPQLLTTLTTDASGIATFTVTVPGTVPPGGTAYFQALTPLSTSNTVRRFNPQPRGSAQVEYGVFGQLSPSVGASRGYLGTREIGDPTGHERCAQGAFIEDDPGSITSGCPGCDFVFGGDASPGDEFPDLGSACADLAGVTDFSAWDFPIGLALAFDYDYGTLDLGYNFAGGTATTWLYTPIPVTIDDAGRFWSWIGAQPSVIY